MDFWVRNVIITLTVSIFAAYSDHTWIAGTQVSSVDLSGRLLDSAQAEHAHERSAAELKQSAPNDEDVRDKTVERRRGNEIPRYVSKYTHRLFTRTGIAGQPMEQLQPEASEQAATRDHHLGASRIILGHCSMTEKCRPGEYCDGRYCFKCKEAGDHCDLNGECCDGSECQYGICEKGVKAGMPGTFCDLAKDCTGPNSCCIHEMSISHYHSVCKPMLEEHESCGPINLFHQDVLRAHMEPICGPCKPGLACKGVGILGRHSICLPENEE